MLASSLSRLLIVALLATTAANAQYTGLTAEGDVATEADFVAGVWFSERGTEPKWSFAGQEVIVDVAVGTAGWEAAGWSHTAPGNSFRYRYTEATATTTVNQDWAYMEVQALPNGASMAAQDSLYEVEGHNQTVQQSIGYVDGTQYEINVENTARSTLPSGLVVQGDFFITVYGWNLDVDYAGNNGDEHWSGDGEAAINYEDMVKAKAASQQLEIYVHNGVFRVEGGGQEGSLFNRDLLVDVNGTTTLKGDQGQEVLKGHRAFWFAPAKETLRLVAMEDRNPSPEPQRPPMRGEQPTEDAAPGAPSPEPEPATVVTVTPATPQETPWLAIFSAAAVGVAGLASAVVFFLVQRDQGQPGRLKAGLRVLLAPSSGKRWHQYGLALIEAGKHAGAHRAFRCAHKRLVGAWAITAAYEAARSAALANNPVAAAQWLLTANTRDFPALQEAVGDAAFRRVKLDDDFQAIVRHHVSGDYLAP